MLHDTLVFVALALVVRVMCVDGITGGATQIAGVLFTILAVTFLVSARRQTLDQPGRVSGDNGNALIVLVYVSLLCALGSSGCGEGRTPVVVPSASVQMAPARPNRYPVSMTPAPSLRGAARPTVHAGSMGATGS